MRTIAGPVDPPRQASGHTRGFKRVAGKKFHLFQSAALILERSIHRTFEIDEAGIRYGILERQYLRTPKTADAVYVTDSCGWNVELRFANPNYTS